MNCTRCNKPIKRGQPYSRTKRGPHHFKKGQCLEALTSVGGKVWVYGTAKLDALTSVGGGLRVYGTAKLEALTSVGGEPYSKKGESR